MDSSGPRVDLRAGSIDQIAISPDIFPFDAFVFDDPNRVSRPNLTMKQPWQFKIGDSDFPWTEDKHGTIPSNGWFGSFSDIGELDLTSELSTLSVSPSAEDLSNSPYGVNGYVEFTFTDFPVSFTNWTVICRHEGTWQYRTSAGVSSGSNITETAGVIKIWANLPYVLPMITSYTSQSFREVLFIPLSLTAIEIESLFNGSDTFISYLSATGVNPSLTLSPQGLLWKSGDNFIRLGDTASFHGVDLDSGNFKAGEQGWQISKEGNVEFNDGTFRGTLEANEVTAGGIHSPGFVTGSSGWNIDSDGSVEFDDGIFRGDITGATGRFNSLLGTDGQHFATTTDVDPLGIVDLSTIQPTGIISGIIIGGSRAVNSSYGIQNMVALVIFMSNEWVLVTSGGSSYCTVSISGDNLEFQWSGTYQDMSTSPATVYAATSASSIVLNKTIIF